MHRTHIGTARMSPKQVQAKASPTSMFHMADIKTAIVTPSMAWLSLVPTSLPGEIRQALNDAASGDGRLDEGQARTWITQADALLAAAHALAAANPS